MRGAIGLVVGFIAVSLAAAILLAAYERTRSERQPFGVLDVAIALAATLLVVLPLGAWGAFAFALAAMAVGRDRNMAGPVRPPGPVAE